MADKQTVTVEDYARSFVEKVITPETFAKEAELQAAGKTLYSLLRRLAKDGDRDDVRIPFKILKDEFGSEWREAPKARQRDLVERLFRILDFVHEECQLNLQHSLQGNAVSEVILEEFRLRIAKMVTGDTWADILPMRMAALKRMYRYMLSENEFIHKYNSSQNLGAKVPDKPKNLTFGKFLKNLTGPARNSWAAVFDDLFLSSGAKLVPLLYALLDENQTMGAELEHCRRPTSESEEGREKGGSVKDSLKESQKSSVGEPDAAGAGTGSEASTSLPEAADPPLKSIRTTLAANGASNLIDLEGTPPPSPPVSTGLARVAEVLERITSMQSQPSAQSSGEWVAFEESSSEPVARPNAHALLNQWSSDSGLGMDSGVTRHPPRRRIPKSASAINRGVKQGGEGFHLPIKAPSARGAVVGSPGQSTPGSTDSPGVLNAPQLSPRLAAAAAGLRAQSMRDRPFAKSDYRPFDGLDPLKKSIS